MTNKLIGFTVKRKGDKIIFEAVFDEIDDELLCRSKAARIVQAVGG